MSAPTPFTLILSIIPSVLSQTLCLVHTYRPHWRVGSSPVVGAFLVSRYCLNTRNASTTDLQPTLQRACALTHPLKSKCGVSFTQHTQKCIAHIKKMLSVQLNEFNTCYHPDDLKYTHSFIKTCSLLYIPRASTSTFMHRYTAIIA